MNQIQEKLNKYITDNKELIGELHLGGYKKIKGKSTKNI